LITRHYYNGMETKICSTCKIEKELSEFGNNKSKLDGKQYYCKECGRESGRKHYLNNEQRRNNIKLRNNSAFERYREFVTEYLLSHPCVDCGESNPLFLDFDHMGDKRYNVSCMRHYSLESIKAEIKKCDVRCLKCHRRKTAIEQNWEWAKPFLN